MGFWLNFVHTFALHDCRTFIARESYAGMHVPDLADGMLSANESLYSDVEAPMMYDPLINNSNAVMRQNPALPALDY